MIGIDTNVLVRYLVQDDAAQFKEATNLLAGLEKHRRSAHLSTITLCETVWVLTRAYRVERDRIVAVLERLLDTSLFVIEDKDAVREAVELYKTGKGDFADYLVGVRARAAGCGTVATFDQTLHQHPDLFCAPAAALKKPRPTTRG
jgi:predicted nucleic-acid-binding protein